MTFNSYVFLFLFLPIVVAGYYSFKGGYSWRLPEFWLIAASLFFYGYWSVNCVAFLISSILVNYLVVCSLWYKRNVLVFYIGIILNLSVLFFYKYFNFLFLNNKYLHAADLSVFSWSIPVAISFITFQQIAYLVDIYRGKIERNNFVEYCLYVSFFPRLIAGPIVRYNEIAPQFSNGEGCRFRPSYLAVGLTMFALGLFKKVVIADQVAPYVAPFFEAAERGVLLTFFESWFGAVSYAFQLYFDFSGYSDMAIGVARMFGIVLPVNFYSPYKASNIIDFWRRWHITLSRFLRDYLYVPLGGNRRGEFRQYCNLLITMLLGGLWHGAGWTFVVWGGMHGLMLSLNHGWRRFRKSLGYHVEGGSSFVGNLLGRLITFLAVVAAWVMFRAETLRGAFNMYSGMVGLHGLSLPVWLKGRLGSLGDQLDAFGIEFGGMFSNGIVGNLQHGLRLFLIASFIVWCAPNTVQWLRQEKPALEVEALLPMRPGGLYWKPNWFYGVVMTIVAAIGIVYIQQENKFLYFQF